MGSFYTNVTLRTTDSVSVRHELTKRRATAYVSRLDADALVVFERDSEDQDPVVLRKLSAALSSALSCAALAVTNHDDSVLLYALFQNGKLVDEYNSAPDYFDEGDKGKGRGGDATLLTATLGVPGEASRIREILALEGGTEDGVVFETDRHEQLVDALGLPHSAIATGYNYLEESEYPEGYDATDFERVGDA